MGKTAPTDADVEEFIAGVKNARRRTDAQALARLMEEVTGEAPCMWGPSIIGYGVHTYGLASGEQARICKIGFSPRASALVLYLGEFDAKGALLDEIGPHARGAGCVYIKSLEDVDEAGLRALLAEAWRA